MTPIVLTEAEREALAYAAELFRADAKRLHFYAACVLELNAKARTLETLLARAGAEQEIEDGN